MMDFNERVIPGVSANFLYQEALARYEFALQLIGSVKKVLDLACGTGYGSAFLANTNSVVGIDRDKEAIEFARKHFGGDVEFNVLDFEREWRRIPDLVRNDKEQFNAICAFEIIEHLNNPQKFLKNAHSILKPKGIMILSTPNANIPTPPNSTKSKYHTKEYTYEEFEILLKKTFKKVVMYGQMKDQKAKEALNEFMKSQRARQSVVNSDRLHIRKLIPKSVKEKIWKYAGSLFGRKAQDELTTKNFPISKKDVENAEYFIAVCKK
jgi:SAM-dependent methyltransferase